MMPKYQLCFGALATAGWLWGQTVEPPSVVLEVRTEAAQCSVIARGTACLRYERPPFPETIGVKTPEFAIVRVTGPDGAAAVIQAFVLTPANRQWLRVRRIGAPVGGVAISDRLPIDLEIYVDGAQALEMRSGRFTAMLTATVAGAAAPVKLPVQLTATGAVEDSISATPDFLPDLTVNAVQNPQPVRFGVAVERHGVGPPFQVSVTGETSDGGAWLRADQQAGFTPCANRAVPCGFDAIVTPPAAAGDYWGALIISGDGYADRVAVRVKVNPAAGQNPAIVTPAQVSLSAPLGSTAPVSTLVTLAGGYDGLAFRAEHGSPWLIVDPRVARWPATLRFFANPVGLEAGLYSETVQIRTVDTGELLFSIPVNFTITAPAYVPAMVDGGGWHTTLYLVNPGLTAVRARLRFWSTKGEAGEAWPLDILGLGVAAEVDGAIVPPLGVRVIETRGAEAAKRRGWAEVAADGPLSVHAVLSETRAITPGRAFSVDATMPVSNPLRDRLLLPFDNLDGARASVLLANPEDQAATVEVTVLNEDGAELAREGKFTLPALGAGAFELPSKWASTANRRGVLALQFDGRRLLASGWRSVDGAGAYAYPAVARGEAGVERGLARVTAGGAWQTSIYLTNASSLPQSGSLRIWPESPARTGGEDEALQSVLPVPAHGVQVTEVAAGAAGGAASLSSWAESRYGRQVSGFALLRQTLAGDGKPVRFDTAVPGQAGMNAKLAIPFDYRGTAKTELILANTADQDTEIQTVIYDFGARFPRFGETFKLAGKAQVSIDGASRWELEGQQGIVVFWSRQNFRLLGVGLRSAGEGPVSALPGYETQ